MSFDRLRHAIAVSILFSAVVFLVWLVYQPALSGPFMMDDSDNLSVLGTGVVDELSLRNYLSTGNAGPLGRPVAKLSFLLNDNAWPSEPYGFKRFNTLLHLLLGILIFQLSRLFLKSSKELTASTSDWLALVVAGVWMILPMHMSTVMYVVQRMTQLSALFCLIGILPYVYLRQKYEQLSVGQLIVISLWLGAAGLLALFSKESGALLVVFIAVIELTLLGGLKASGPFVWWRRLCVYLPTLGLIAYILYLPNWSGGYNYRDFSLYERVLTQSVILWEYLFRAFSMRVYGLGVFHDDQKIYSSLLDAEVITSVLAWFVVIVSALVFRKRYPIAAFAVLWFVGGHLLESTTVSLELYFEHRNYLPLLGPLYFLIIISYTALRKISNGMAKMAMVFYAAIFLVSSAITAAYASEWGSVGRIVPIWSAEHPESSRAQRAYAQYLASIGLPEAALDVLDAAYSRMPNDLSLPLISIAFSCENDLRLRYSIDELKMKLASHRWANSIRVASERLVNLFPVTQCSYLAPQLSELFAEMDQLLGKGLSQSGVVSMQVLGGNLLFSMGDFKGALEFYKRVERLAPSEHSARRLAVFYFRAGHYRFAREALEAAFERDARSGISQVEVREYEVFFSRIDSYLRSVDEF